MPAAQVALSPNENGIDDGPPVVWVGDGFARAGVCAFQSEGDFRPHLHGVPATFAKHHRLLQSLGVRDRSVSSRRRKASAERGL